MKNQRITRNPSSHKDPSSSSSSHHKNRDTTPPDHPSLAESRPSNPSNPQNNPVGPSSGSPVIRHLDRSIPPSIPTPIPLLHALRDLERRTLVLADGSTRSYFALPADHQLDPPADRFFPGGHIGHVPGLGLGFDKQFLHPSGRFSPEDIRRGPHYGYRSSPLLDGPQCPPEGGPSSLKRKFPEEDDLFARHQQRVLQYGNPSVNANWSKYSTDEIGGKGSPPRRDRDDDVKLSKNVKLGGDSDVPSQRSRPDSDVQSQRGRSDSDAPSQRGLPSSDVPPAAVDVDQRALRMAFLRFSKSINEERSVRKKYLEDGKQGPLQCIACGRSDNIGRSKEFADVHRLIVHAYNSQNADLRVDHLGLHRALCVLMGWNYSKAPEDSKAYQSLSADDAAANREDLIIWPPVVIIHNTNAGKRKIGRMEGMSNQVMDIKLKDLGFGGGKSRLVYGGGSMGLTVVRFANSPAGLKEAERLSEYFKNDKHGREDWARAQASQSGDDDNMNPALVKVDKKTGEKSRIFYGYLATTSNLDIMSKRAIIKSRREFDASD